MAVAAAGSLALGVGLYLTVGGLPEPYEQIFEGSTLLVATLVVTWMLFWMRRQAAGVGGELRAAMDHALSYGGAWGLTALAFSAIIREGIETSLFLVGQVEAASRATDLGAASVLVGAIIGLAFAVEIGIAFYRGSRRVNLAGFFRWTGIALVFIAAGLLSGAIHEFVEIGAIGVGTTTAYDITGVLSDEAGVGAFLHALFGFRSAPEVLTVLVHIAYLGSVLSLYVRPPRIASPVRVEVETTGS